jgi:mRNA interferase MazF
MTSPNYIPAAGDLIWTDFDPTKGREQAGRRPGLVVSSAVFSKNTGLAVVCPITSRVRPFPTSVVLPSGLPITGEILTSHILASTRRRGGSAMRGAKVPLEVAQLVRGKLNAFITIRLSRTLRTIGLALLTVMSLVRIRPGEPQSPMVSRFVAVP